MEVVQPPLARVTVGGLQIEANGQEPGWEECSLAVKNVKPCLPPPHLTSDTRAAPLQTRCPFPENAVHVVGGERWSGGGRGNGNTSTSSYHLGV